MCDILQMMIIKLFVDDERDPPSSDWLVARTYKEAIDILTEYHVNILSLDHDLGTKKDGYDIVCEIEAWTQDDVLKNFVPDKIIIHTQNSPEGLRMRQAVRSIERLRNG